MTPGFVYPPRSPDELIGVLRSEITIPKKGAFHVKLSAVINLLKLNR